jgi:hypothetical protein
MPWPLGRRWPVAEGGTEAVSRQVVRFAKDMGITHAEFFRTMQSLIAGEDVELDARGLTIRRGPARIEIRLGPEGTRALGRFQLPRTEVEFVFRNCPDGEIAAFVERFDTRFRRGGG